MKRRASKNDAEVIVCFCAGAAYITGKVIRVTGGARI
jgi:hypothetical protein